MNPERLGVVEADLVDWGLLERAETLRWSRRLRGAVMRGAARLQAEEQAGRRPEGHPIENVVREALKEYPLPPGAETSRDHVAFLVAVEVAALPEGVRALLNI